MRFDFVRGFKQFMTFSCTGDKQGHRVERAFAMLLIHSTRSVIL